MSLEIVRRVRGNVHGTIDLSALEDAVLSHEIVQRLRRIKQTAFLSYVFPGATHTRFEHSLGVMQLAGVAWDKLKDNQSRLAAYAQTIPQFAAQEKNPTGLGAQGLLAPTFPIMQQIFDSDYNLQVVRLSGLLHDIGHPPFSHSGERFLPSWSEVLKANPDVPDYLREFLHTNMEKLSSEGKDPKTVRVRHEVYSLLIAEKILRETYEQFPNLRLQIDPRDIISVITPQIKPDPTSPLSGMGVYKMLNELIAGEIDIDRMDYLLRDSRECGVVYGIFDAGRILDGLCLYFDDVDKSLHLAIRSSSLAAFEDYLRARQSMYLQVYFHKTSASAEAMMQYLARLLGGWTLPSNIQAYVDIDEYNIGAILSDAAEKQLSDIYEKKEFERVLKDLLYRRRLWKMVYENSWSGSPQDGTKQTVEWVKDEIQKLKVEFEQVSSMNYVTRFRTKQGEGRSRNYLRLIKKDELGCPRVVPIEDYSSIIAAHAQEKIFVQRIYVDGKTDVKGENVTDVIKRNVRKHSAVIRQKGTGYY